MGIQNLNRFLRKECPDSIRMMPILELSGKKIVIDISIYLYKFEAENALIENMYLMLSIFHYYNIIPLFIFDGKPPAEKKELIIERIQEKKKAENEYYLLKQITSETNSESYELQKKMEALKKRFIYFKKEKIEEVKKLITAYGASYYEAPSEADEICAALVIQKKVWACLTEDMDMFAYGCPRVLRYISLLKHTVVLYDTESILQKLRITQKELREICVVSGTDYNKNMKTPFHLYKVLTLFKLFRKQIRDYKDDTLHGFYEWLQIENYVTDTEYACMKKIDILFDFTNDIQLNDIRLSKNLIKKNDMISILRLDGFIFA